jgi:hypothetical protein
MYIAFLIQWKENVTKVENVILSGHIWVVYLLHKIQLLYDKQLNWDCIATLYLVNSIS